MFDVAQKYKPLVIFFLLSYLFVILLALPAILTNYNLIDLEIPFEPILILGSWTPNIAAFLVIAFLLQRKGGIRELFSRWLMWREKPFWYLIAVSPLLVAAIAVGLYHLVNGSPPGYADSVSFSDIMILFVLALITGAMGEELGWRGFALPRLQTSMSAFWASMVVGILWGFWHLPLWFTGLGWEEMSLGLFTYNCVAISVIITWVNNNTKGNLLLVTLIHLFYNFGWNLIGMIGQVPMEKTLIYQAVVLTFYAAGVVIIYGPERLTRKDEIPIDFKEKYWDGL